jgi:hypothetical protein
MLASQCPRISTSYLIEEKRRMSSVSMYQQEYECAFIELSGALFTQADIDSMRVEGDALVLTDRFGGGVGGADAIRAALSIDVGVLL